MNKGIMEQNRLIDILKTIVGSGAKKQDPIERIVKKYFDLYFLPLKKVSSNEDLVYFINPKGKAEFVLSPKMKALKVKSSEFSDIMGMFDIDEDSLEQIFKVWMNENFDVDIHFIDYYNS